MDDNVPMHDRDALEFDPTHVVRIVIGDMVIDRAKRTAMYGATPIYLTRKEFDLLACLASYKGRTARRENIMAYLYGNPHIERLRCVKVFLTYVRKGLKRAGIEWEIKSMRQGGYMLVIPPDVSHVVVCSPPVPPSPPHV